MNTLKCFSLGFCLLMLVGCQSDPYRLRVPKDPVNTFSNADWAAVLAKVATPDGYVKWSEFQGKDHETLNKLLSYLGELSVASPENRPDLFPENHDRAAYWINAYNAESMYWVILHQYPATAPFYRTDPVLVGNRTMSIPEIQSILEGIDANPSIYFALNWDASGCPPLRKTPYDGPVLDAQLRDQGQVFLSDPRGAQRQGNTVLLSAWILQHRGDFTRMVGMRPDDALLLVLSHDALPDSPVQGARKIGRLMFNMELNRPPR